jgi:hypothetical protein
MSGYEGQAQLVRYLFLIPNLKHFRSLFIGFNFSEVVLMRVFIMQIDN